MRQQANGHPIPEGIKTDAPPVVGQGFKMLDPGMDWGGRLRAARAGLGFDPRQRRCELVGRQTVTGVLAQFPGEATLGFVVLDLEVAAHAATAVRGARFLPSPWAVETVPQNGSGSTNVSTRTTG